MLGFRSYIIMILMGATVAASGLAYWYNMRVDALKVELAAVRGELETCANRISNIQEDMLSDATVPDDPTLYDIPSEWVLPDDDTSD